MKKREIITLFEYHKILRMRRWLENYQQSARMRAGLREYPEILRQKLEFQESIKNYDKKTNYQDITKNINCEHQIVLYVHGLFQSTYECVLCGKRYVYYNDQLPKLNETIELEQTSYNKDGIRRRYNFYEIYHAIMEIIKDKDDDDEIDFLNEFTKQFEMLNIGDLIINGKELKKIYNVLIIGGSNDIKVDNTVSFNNETSNKLEKIITRFYNIYRINITLIDSKNSINKDFYQASYEYITLEDLMSNLENVKDTNFDLIVDATNLLKSEVKDGVISISPFTLNLKEMFPHSTIFSLNEQMDIFNLINLVNSNETFSNDFKKLVLKKWKNFQFMNDIKSA